MNEEKAFWDKQKDLLKIIQLIETFKEKYNLTNMKDILKWIELSQKINSLPRRNKTLLVKDIIIKLERKFGKLVPIKEIKKKLRNKINEKDINDAIDMLTISGDIFHPIKNFIQRM